MEGSALRRGVRILAIVLVAVLPACGGGGKSESGSAYPSKILGWVAPNSFTNSDPLNPAADLDSFEIYVKESGAFSGSDVPLAMVAALDPVSRQPVTSFDLANLGPFLSKGVQYRVSVRAVALSGAKSDFSSPASFSF